MTIAEGDAMPDVQVQVTHPNVKVAMTRRCAGKKVIVVGLPGAFTPT